MRRILKFIGIAFLVVLLALAGVGAYMHKSYPTLKANSEQEADRVAKKMLQAINDSAWQETRAISWRFTGHEYLWDKDREAAQVVWGDTRVLLRLNDQSGKAFEDGEELQGEDLREALETAWGFWCNDSFWLNPMSKIFDPGTTRYLVEERDQEHVLVKYGSGGVTPGDSYLWTLAPDGKPEKWEMWVNIIPVGGVPAKWQGWDQLRTGAWISTQRGLPLGLKLKTERVDAAASLKQLLGNEPDPFMELEE